MEMLPAGSIVELKDLRKVMIIGYSPNKINEEKFDYICTNLETGINKEIKDLKKDEDYYFIKKNQIMKVIFIGYSDYEFDLYEKYTAELKKKISELNKQKIEITEEKLKGIVSEINAEITAEIRKKKGESNER